jgi:hypothetical protein
MRAPRFVRAVVATALLTAVTAWSGVAAATTTTGSVRLTGDTVDLSFAGETVASDGSVTDTWTNAAGWQFVYTGPAGAQLQESMTPAAGSGTTLDLAASAPAGVTQQWCVKAIQGSGYRMTACNVRTTLYSAPNNHYIADDMTSQAHASSGLRYDSVYMTYNWNGNQIISMDPLGDVGTHCSQVSFGVTWYGLSFSADELTCQGTLRPWGQSSNQGGGNWQSNLANPTGTIGIEEILKTHAPARTTPASVLHLRAVWS